MVSRNKKAQMGDAITWLYKFIILVVVVGGIVAIVLNHYSKAFDIRDAEAQMLAKKIVECIAPDGIVKEFSNETIKNCFPINKQELYLNITLDETSFINGNSFLFTLCKAMEQKVRVKKYPVCHHSKYLLLNNNKLSTLNIFIAIRKIEKNL